MSESRGAASVTLDPKTRDALAEALYRWRWPSDPELKQFGPESMRGAVEAVEQALLTGGELWREDPVDGGIFPDHPSWAEISRQFPLVLVIKVEEPSG